MRPRVFPAEDLQETGALVEVSAPCFNEAAGIPRGRRAEWRQGRATLTAASMRPRVFPAEDARCPPPLAPARRASMRPRVFPAEDGPRADA